MRGKFLRPVIGVLVSFWVGGVVRITVSWVTYIRSWAPLQLGFDLPREVGFAVFAQDDVVAVGVEVFCV